MATVWFGLIFFWEVAPLSGKGQTLGHAFPSFTVPVPSAVSDLPPTLPPRLGRVLPPPTPPHYSPPQCRVSVVLAVGVPEPQQVFVPVPSVIFVRGSDVAESIHGPFREVFEEASPRNISDHGRGREPLVISFRGI